MKVRLSPYRTPHILPPNAAQMVARGGLEPPIKGQSRTVLAAMSRSSLADLPIQLLRTTLT